MNSNSMDEEPGKFNSKSMEEEPGKSKYAYCLSSIGFIRVEISNIEDTPKYKLQRVLRVESPRQIPTYAALLSYNNSVYLVGGLWGGDMSDTNNLLLKFDHNKFQETYPPNSMASAQFLKESGISYPHMVQPRVIPAGENTYFIHPTRLHSDSLHSDKQVFGFQSFNVKKNCFVKLPDLPLLEFFPPDRLDFPYAHFLLGSCIYFFAVGSLLSIYTFNTSSLGSSEWKENKSLASLFFTKKFPLFNHIGDVGLSDECPLDKTRIMVALHSCRLIAYLVRVVEGWESFEPISYRFLEESHMDGPRPRCQYEWAHLADFGGGKFCVIHGSEFTQFLIYVFTIDFKTERKIQKLNCPQGMTSSTILSYEVFDAETLNYTPSTRYPRIRPHELCFLSAAPASRANRKIQTKMIGTSQH